ILLLLIFILVSPLFLLGYSLLVRPIYVIGRYEATAQPFYLILLALGICCAQNRAAQFNRALAEIVPIAGLGFLAFFSLKPIYQPHAFLELRYAADSKGEILEKYSG